MPGSRIVRPTAQDLADCGITSPNIQFFTLLSAGGVAQADVPIILSSPVRSFGMAGRTGGAVPIWLHFMKIGKDTSGGNIVPNGTETWMPIRDTSQLPWQGYTFKKEFQNLFATVDFSSGATAVTLFFTSDLENIIPGLT
jgi:hypothetical protein